MLLVAFRNQHHGRAPPDVPTQSRCQIAQNVCANITIRLSASTCSTDSCSISHLCHHEGAVRSTVFECLILADNPPYGRFPLSPSSQTIRAADVCFDTRQETAKLSPARALLTRKCRLQTEASNDGSRCRRGYVSVICTEPGVGNQGRGESRRLLQGPCRGDY